MAMARDHRRAELEVRDVLGMFRQASISFKASIPLFLTLALLSSVYETAVERSALLSNISFSAKNSNFSFQFGLDPKQQAAQTPHKELNMGGLRKQDTGDSLLSRLLMAFLPPDDALQPEGVTQREPTTSALMGSDVEDTTELKHEELSSPPMDSDVGNAVKPQGLQPEEVNHGELSPDTENPSALESLQGVVVHEDGDSSKDGGGDTRMSNNGRQLDQNGFSGGNVDSDTIDKLESLQEAVHQDGDSGKDSGGLTADSSDNGKQIDQNSISSENADSDTIEFEDKNWIHGNKEGDEESLFEDMFEKNEMEDTDAYSDLPHLKIETISNETKRLAQETVLDAIDLTFFTGKLLGGRGLDQGAMPHGGMTMLLLFLLVVAVVTIFLAIVGFQHAAVLGSIAYSVVSTHMGKRASARQAIRSSLKSSIGRLMWLAILHATLRGLQSLFFMKTLFGGVMEMEQVEQLVLRLSATPFAFLAPFMDVDATNIGMSVRIGLFVAFDYIFDGIAYCIYVVACWVTIMERNHWGLGAVSRSCNLVKSMEVQALVVRLLEAMVCGRTSRWLLQQVIGQFASAFVICAGQVYFLVLWLIFYMSARSIHDHPSHFSYGTLEDFLDRFK